MTSLTMRAALLAALCAIGVSTADAQEPFYKGKRLTLVINFAAGGPTDIEGRLLAKHIAKHIDGQPTIIVQNKDGAGGLVGTIFSANSARATAACSATSPAPRGNT